MKSESSYLSVVYNKNRVPASTYPHELARYLVSRFEMKKGDHFLEIGCGRGDFLSAFVAEGIKGSGVDLEISANLLNQGIEVKAVDLSKDPIPYPDASFDVIYSKSVLEHFYSPETYFKEVRRLLKPGGKCIIMTPDWVTCMRVFYEDFTHCRPYDKTAVRDVLLMNGFESVHTEQFYQLPILWKIPALKIFSRLLRLAFNEVQGRRLTSVTKIKFFRWSSELMILGYGRKPQSP